MNADKSISSVFICVHLWLVFFEDSEMPDLIPPHGGLTEPVDRRVADLGSIADLPLLRVSKADQATLDRIADGGLSPLIGPMTRKEWDRVLDDEVIVRGGKNYAWTIPLALPVSEPEADAIRPGEKAALTDESGQPI